MKHNCSIFALVLVLTASQASAAPSASTVTAERQVQLMSEALYARDTGALAGARQRLEELLALNPSDEAVKALLASLDAVPQKKVIVAGGPQPEPAAGTPASTTWKVLVAAAESPARYWLRPRATPSRARARSGRACARACA